MSETKKPGFFKRLFGFGGAEETPESPESEKPAAAEQPTAKAPVEKKPAPKKGETRKAETKKSESKAPAAKKPASKDSSSRKPAASAAKKTSAKKPAAKSAAKTSAAKPTAEETPAGAKKTTAKTSLAKTSAKSTSAKATAAKSTSAKSPSATKTTPAPKKPAAKSAAKPATKAETSSKTPREGEGTSTSVTAHAPKTEEEKRREDEHSKEMQPKTPPPDQAPVSAPGHERPEEKQPSRRTEEAPEADDEAGPASPRPPAPDGEPAKKDERKDKPERTAPPAGPGPADDDEEEAGPTAPEPKQFKTTDAEPTKKRGWFAQLRDGLSRTSNALSENISSVLTKERLDEDTLDDLEDVLIRADLGIDIAERVRGIIAKNRYDRGATADAVREVLGDEVTKVLDPVAQTFPEMSEKPFVWLVVGVNGTGKTTTIGKLSHRFKSQGKSVMLAAADTFRAAAIDQLKVWGDRVDAPVVAHDVGSDPAGVAYDGLKRAQESNTDVLMIDTAGRLQNKSDLMDELAKIVRVLKKFDPDAPHGVLLVLDATTGQNAINQVELFQQVAGVTGLVVTKLDGTARGGILVAIAERFGLPVHAIGVGEGIEDLESFDAEDFARAIAGFGRENAKAA